MADPHVKVDFKPITAIADAVEQARGTSTTTTAGKAFKVWAHIYRAYLRNRFDRFSKGGGNWAKLSSATLNARRRKVRGWKLKRGQTWKKKRFKKGTAISVDRAPKILRDTGTLFAALQPNFVRAPGQLESRVSFGIRVGFGGPGKHSGKKKGSTKKTIADIAAYHQTGGGRLPQRKIIVDPDTKTMNKLAIVFVKFLERARDGG